MSSKSELSGLVNAFVQGGDIEDVAFGEGGTSSADSQTPDTTEESVDPNQTLSKSQEQEGDPIDALLNVDDSEESESATEDEQDSNSKESTDPKAAKTSDDPNAEWITVTDNRGQRKVKIDYTNREQIKKAVQQAYGMRKFQAERDVAFKERDTLKADLERYRGTVNRLDEIYAEGGAKALVDALEGQGAFDKYISQTREVEEFRKKASPAELARFEADQTIQQLKNQIAKQTKEIEDFKESVSKERLTSEEKALQAQVYPAFDKYRFEGKLGDPAEEVRIDKMIWNSAKADLEEYESQGVQLTPELIDKTFKEYYLTQKRFVNTQAKKQTSKVVNRKKEEALTNVQTRTMKGMDGNRKVKEAAAELDKGNITNFLTRMMSR